MLLMHMPATIAVFGKASLDGTGAAWSSLVLLTATNAFFVFEIIFAKSLRLLTNRRCLIVFLLIVTLLHAGVIDRVMPDVVPDHGVGLWLIVTVVTAVVLSASMRLAVIALAATVFDAADYVTRLRRQYAWRTVTPIVIPRYSPFRNATVLRAPPFN